MVFSVASDQNPKCSLYLQVLVSGKVAKTYGFHCICRVLSVASGLVGGKLPKPTVFIAFAGAWQWQVAKTYGFHGICRGLAVASGPSQVSEGGAVARA